MLRVQPLTVRLFVYLALPQTMNAQQTKMYLTHRRQLYRMLLRVAEVPASFPTPEARAFLRDYTREAFRRHRNVKSPEEAEELLRRAHTCLLIIAEGKD